MDCESHVEGLGEEKSVKRVYEEIKRKRKKYLPVNLKNDWLLGRVSDTVSKWKIIIIEKVVRRKKSKTKRIYQVVTLWTLWEEEFERENKWIKRNKKEKEKKQHRIFLTCDPNMKRFCEP